MLPKDLIERIGPILLAQEVGDDKSELIELAKAVDAANEDYQAWVDAGKEHILSFTPDCHLFYALVGYMNGLLDTLEVDEAPPASAPLPSVPVEATKPEPMSAPSSGRDAIENAIIARSWKIINSDEAVPTLEALAIELGTNATKVHRVLKAAKLGEAFDAARGQTWRKAGPK